MRILLFLITVIYCNISEAFKCSETLTDVPVSECQALNQLYYELNVENSSLPEQIKSEWGSSTHRTVCDTNYQSEGGPQGLYCESGHLSEIRIFAGLNGELTSVIGEFSQLKKLSLWGNDLTGTLPKELGTLSQLEMLLMNGNNLVGSIPRQLGDASALKTIDLHLNDLSGSIPNQLANINLLETLSLSGNRLTGTIPSALTNSNALTSINLSENYLSGPVPDFSNWAQSSVAISENCLFDFPETPQHVVDWLENTRPSSFKQQFNRAACHEDNDLIFRNGAGVTFQGRELLPVIEEDFWSNSVTINNQGFLELVDANTWQAVPYPYTVTENTSFRFTFQANVEPDFAGIGFTFRTDDVHPVPYTQGFQITGTEDWYVNESGDYEYTAMPLAQGLCIPVGEVFTGPVDYLVFVNDNDSGVVLGEVSLFGNYELSETPCP